MIDGVAKLTYWLAGCQQLLYQLSNLNIALVIQLKEGFNFIGIMNFIIINFSVLSNRKKQLDS